MHLANLYALKRSDPIVSGAGRVLHRFHSGKAEESKAIAEGRQFSNAMSVGTDGRV